MFEGRFRIVFLLLLMLASAPAFGQAEHLLARSDSLMAEGDFYEAVLVLEPLLTTDDKSPAQEEALWQANALCETLVRDYILMNEFDEAHGSRLSARNDLCMKWGKVRTLNELGADIDFREIEAQYRYRYGFLARMVASYPDGGRRSSAEYYLIRRGVNGLQEVERWLNELHAYVDRYTGTGLRELYSAYLDIAHINDNLWTALTYRSDRDNAELFGSGDPAIDAPIAARHKAEALKYYAKVTVSGFGGRFRHENRADIVRRLQELRDGKGSPTFWITYD